MCVCFCGLFSALPLCVMEELCRIFLAFSGPVLPSVLQVASFKPHLNGQTIHTLYTEIGIVSVSVLQITMAETYSPCDGID